MRIYSLEELEPFKELNRELTLEIIEKRVKGNKKVRIKSKEETKISCTRSLENWNRLMSQGKIFFRGSRNWLMEWDN